MDLGHLRLVGIARDTNPVAGGNGDGPVDALLVKGLVEEGEEKRPVLNRFGLREPERAEEEEK